MLLNINGRLIYDTDENHNLLNLYTYDSQGNPASMNFDGYYYLYQVNGHGDVTRVTTPFGDVVAEYEYDAWGNIIYEYETMSEINPFRYAGYIYDEETDLYYLNSRYYDPKLGRFLTKDTVPKINHYVYANNNPVMFVDPSGHYAVAIGANLFGGKIVGGNLDILFAVDTNWNIGFLINASAGTSISPSLAYATGGVQTSFSTVNSIFDLEGESVTSGGNIGIGKVTGGYDVNISTEGKGITHNLSLGLGGDIGWLPATVEEHVFYGETRVVYNYNIKETYTNLKDSIIQFITNLNLVKN